MTPSPTPPFSLQPPLPFPHPPPLSLQPPPPFHHPPIYPSPFPLQSFSLPHPYPFPGLFLQGPNAHMGWLTAAPSPPPTSTSQENLSKPLASHPQITTLKHIIEPPKHPKSTTIDTPKHITEPPKHPKSTTIDTPKHIPAPPKQTKAFTIDQKAFEITQDGYKALHVIRRSNQHGQLLEISEFHSGSRQGVIRIPE
ncbi:hypothetical protein FCV25MIE_22216, partial [Fagus crenata]